MAAPTTVVQFWTEQNARLAAALAAQQTLLADMLAAESAANAFYVAAGKDVAAAQADVDAARKALAGIATPADGDPLLVVMQNALIGLGNARAALVIAEDNARESRAARKAAGEGLQRLTGAAGAAVAALDAAHGAADKRAAEATAATSAPASDVPGQAAQFLADFQAAASANVQSDFPSNADSAKDFLTAVRARRAQAAAVATAAAGQAAAAAQEQRSWNESTGRAAAATPALQAAFDAAVAAVQNFLAAGPLVAAAGAALQALAERTSSPLSAAQRAALDTADATLKAERENALAKLKARDDAQQALRDATDTYAAALLTARAGDVDASEADLLAADAALQAKRDAIDDGQTDLTAADGQLLPVLPVLDAWFAAVPETLWTELEVLDAALARLGGVQGAVPATLVAAVVSAEAPLAANLDAAAREARKDQLLADAVAASQGTAASAADMDLRRQAATLRFDAVI